MSKLLQLCAAGLLAMTLLCVGLRPAMSQDRAILNFSADYVWHQIYQRAEGLKAMAIADNGAVGIATGHSFQASAEAQALEACTQQSRYFALKQPTTPECKLVAYGNQWLAQELEPDPAWQQPLPGKDRPMQKAYRYLVPNSKGIILHVHGCDGRGGKVFSDVWGAYFNALGFDFIVPDSFAVKRPKPVCGFSVDYPAQQVSDVTRLRVRQTQQAIAGLRKSNPGKPIYLWGHSEGGFIVQLVAAKVDGIIVSGEECGAYGVAPASGPDVPLLYIWGEFDQFVNGLGLFKVEKNGVVECRRRMLGFNVEAAFLAGRGHNPFPWIRGVNEAVAQFLKVQPIKVSVSSLTKTMARRWKQTRVDKRYRNASQHRAAAINAAGSSYMVWGLDNVEDASQLALFGCALSVGRKTNVFKSGKHICALVDVNGAAPK